VSDSVVLEAARQGATCGGATGGRGWRLAHAVADRAAYRAAPLAVASSQALLTRVRGSRLAPRRRKDLAEIFSFKVEGMRWQIGFLGRMGRQVWPHRTRRRFDSSPSRWHGRALSSQHDEAMPDGEARTRHQARLRCLWRALL
jgi:hypothetical protein